jgi:hypothetical protein
VKSTSNDSAAIAQRLHNMEGTHCAMVIFAASGCALNSSPGLTVSAQLGREWYDEVR